MPEMSPPKLKIEEMIAQSHPQAIREGVRGISNVTIKIKYKK